MKVVLITMVNNEEDIIEAFIRYHAAFVDKIVIADHHSSDRTPEIVSQLIEEGLPIELLTVQTIDFCQQEVMSSLLYKQACLTRADWILPLDADEFLVSDGDVQASFTSMDQNHAYYVPRYVYVPTPVDNQHEINPLKRIQKRVVRTYPELSKVIAPYTLASNDSVYLSMGNHHLLRKEHDSSVRIPALDATLFYIAHFPVRNVHQLEKKMFFNWPKSVARGIHGQSTHRGEWFEYLMTHDHLTPEHLQQIASRYSSLERQMNNPVELIDDPLHAPELRYTKADGSDEYYKNMVKDISRIALNIAKELATYKGKISQSPQRISTLRHYCNSSTDQHSEHVS